MPSKVFSSVHDIFNCFLQLASIHSPLHLYGGFSRHSLNDHEIIDLQNRAEMQRVMNQNVDLVSVWRPMATIAGGEVIPSN